MRSAGSVLLVAWLLSMLLVLQALAPEAVDCAMATVRSLAWAC